MEDIDINVIDLYWRYCQDRTGMSYNVALSSSCLAVEYTDVILRRDGTTDIVRGAWSNGRDASRHITKSQVINPNISDSNFHSADFLYVRTL